MLAKKSSAVTRKKSAGACNAITACECRCRSPIHMAVRGLGCALVAYGILLMAAWHLHWTGPLQLGSAHTIIAYNTCLALAMAGAGVLAANSCRFAWSAVLGAALAMVSGLIGAEYALGFNLGLDQLLINQAGLQASEHPGRIAPNTLLGLGLTGVSLLVLSGRTRARVRSLLASLLGSLIVALSLAVLLGYSTGIASAGWAGMKPMAPQAAAGLFVLGLAVLGLVWRRETEGQTAAPVWLPLPVSVVLIAVTLLLWNALRQPGQPHAALPAMTLILGTGMALLSGVALWQAQASRFHSRQLHKTSLYARSLIEASLDPLVTISKQGKITDVNQATEQATGLARSQLIGSDFCDYFTEPEEARQGYQKVFAEGHVRDYPLAIRSRSGQVTDVLYNATLYKNEAGEIEGVFAAARDITERKRAEEELRKASQYARSLIEASLDPLVTISKEGKITDVNQATEQVTGLSRERLIGSDFSDYFTQPEEARQGYRKVFAEGNVRDYPLALRSQSGQITDVLYNATVFKNETGEMEGVFAAARDITERKRAEEEIRRMKRGAGGPGGGAHRRAGHHGQRPGGVHLLGVARPAGAAAADQRLCQAAGRGLWPFPGGQGAGLPALGAGRDTTNGTTGGRSAEPVAGGTAGAAAADGGHEFAGERSHCRSGGRDRGP